MNKMEIEITLERVQRVSETFLVTEEQLESLKKGENPFEEELLRQIGKGDEEIDWAVNDEDGRTIVDWNERRY